MDESTNKEKVLKNIRNALISRQENPFQNIDLDSPVCPPLDETPDVYFAREFTRAGGKFVYCESEVEMQSTLSSLLVAEGLLPVYAADESIRALLASRNIEVLDIVSGPQGMRTSVTYCEFLVARTGSIMMSSRLAGGRRLMVLPEVHIVIAFSSQIVAEIRDAFEQIREKYQDHLPSSIPLITGPSRTADIEKTLIMGAHGPRELYVFLVDNSELL